jgi:hypothetical protein
MEDIGLRQQPEERAPLCRLPAEKAAAAVERPVGFGMEAVALEDDEPRVHPSLSQRLDVRPRDAGSVDGAMDDPENSLGSAQASHSTWSK